MKRQDLRKVKYKQSYLSGEDCIPKVDEGFGFFHKWEMKPHLSLREGTGNLESYIVALVETEEGFIKMINYKNIKFLD